MLLARVVGNVVATVKDGALEGHKLLLVELLVREGRGRSRTLVALDAVGAGAGELVYICRGKEAGFAWPGRNLPTDAAVVGIADPAANPHYGPEAERPA